MTNREANQVRFSGGFDFRSHVSDVRMHLELDRVQKRLNLAQFPLSDQFDTTIGEVADVSRDLETPSERLAREAKPHPLDAAREMNSMTIPRHKNLPRGRSQPAR
jgi:hypothetical protein